MKKVLILAMIILLASCEGESSEIHLVKNIFLSHNGDDRNSGYEIVKKIDVHNYEGLIDDYAREVYCDSTNIFVKTEYGTNLHFFYHISFRKSMEPVVLTIPEHRFIEKVKQCNSCKSFKIHLDTVAGKWIVK